MKIPDTGMADQVALILEDEALIAMDVGASLMGAGYCVATFASCSDAIIWLEHNPPPAVAVVDVELLDGRCDCVAMRLADLSVPFVVHSAGPRRLREEIDAFARGTWLPKPSSTADLLHAVSTATKAPMG